MWAAEIVNKQLCSGELMLESWLRLPDGARWLQEVFTPHPADDSVILFPLEWTVLKRMQTGREEHWDQGVWCIHSITPVSHLQIQQEKLLSPFSAQNNCLALPMKTGWRVPAPFVSAVGKWHHCIQFAKASSNRESKKKNVETSPDASIFLPN